MELKQLSGLTFVTTMRVNFEISKLAKEETKRQLPIFINTNVDFIETTTGLSGLAISPRVVELLKKLSQGKIRMKALVGIRT